METIFVESSPTSVMSLRNIILESQKRHSNLDWANIAARKIHSLFMKPAANTEKEEAPMSFTDFLKQSSGNTHILPHVQAGYDMYQEYLKEFKNKE